MSLVRVNFQQESEDGLNALINSMLNFSYNIKAMVYYYDCSEVALRGFSVFYRVIWDELVKTIDVLCMYQIKRGGCVKFREIKAPDNTLWSKGIDSLQYLVQGLQLAFDGCNKLHDIGKKNNDPHLQHFLEDEIMDKIVLAIKLVGDRITRLTRAGTTGLGEYEFDRDLYLRTILVEFPLTVPHRLGMVVDPIGITGSKVPKGLRGTTGFSDMFGGIQHMFDRMRF